VRLTAGTRLGAYEVIEPIGAGGMGEVYRAHDTRVGRDVAIKVLPQRLSRDDEARARFEREAKAVAAISHPNVLALYEFEQEGDFAFVVTELLEGETLRTALSRGPLSWRRACEIGAAVADGLAAAHAKRIIHRDLKPENVFLTTDGRVKLLDFGLARTRTRPQQQDPTDDLVPTQPMHSDEFESDSRVIGTVGYMAPEQLRGESVTPATDIFALGCILFECVMGRRAFLAQSPIDTMTAVLRDNLPPVTESGARVPHELDRLIHRCVEKHPDARFQSAGDLAFALRALTGEPAPLFSAAHRKWMRIAAAAVAVAVLIAAAFAVREYFRPPERIESLAVMPFINDTKSASNDYLSDGLTESVINNLSQIPDLSVVSRTSVFRYKGKATPPQEIARDLKVQALLTGRIIAPPGELIISTELIDGRTNRHLWGGQYRTRLADLVGVQSTISRQIAEQLRLELSEPARRKVEKRPTASAEAYRLYLQGRYEWNKRTGEAFERAIDYFQRAIRHDPAYALAYAGLADTYILQSIYNEKSPVVVLPLAREAARRAIALDDQLAEAHTSLAYFKMNFDADHAAAAEEFERAIQLNPSYATARQWYSRCLVEMGRYDEAIREIRRAESLDPLSLIIIAELGGVYADAGRLDEAVAECKRALALEPDFAFGHYVLAGAYLKQQRFNDAIREAKVAWDQGGDPRSLVRLGLCQAAGGRRDAALQTLASLENLSRTRFVSSYGMATLMLALGRTDDAAARLERAAAELPSGQFERLLSNDPALATIRKKGEVQ
jgi:serine/threonine-protein kinase